MNPYENNLKTPSDIQEHLGLLNGLAMRCDQVVELGFRTGISTSAFLASGAKVWSVDIEVRCKRWVRNLARLYPDTFTFKVGDSRTIEIPECDMLFIDTDHTYATTKAELERHGPRVKRWIALHDTVTFGQEDRTPGTGPGIFTAIQEYLLQHPWEVWLHLPNNNGLTVLRRTP